MKKIIQKLLTAFILIISCTAVSADSLELETVISSLSKNEMKIFEDQGIVYRYGKERKGLYYIPPVSLSENILNRHGKLNPDVTVEAVFRIPYPEDFPTGDSRDIFLYNTIRRVSNISGVQYFSERKDRYRVLFEDVYTVDNNRKKIEDSTVALIPDYDSFHMHMKEANLGRDYYLAEYLYDGREMSFSLTNTSNMNFLLKVVGEGDMQIDLLLFPLENELIIYGYCGVKLANPEFVEKVMNPYSSFFRRLYAMETWLYNSIYNTENIPLILDNPQR